MIIYNVTTKIEWPVADEWVQWMKDEHIPAILSTGCFTRYQFVKLLEVDNVDGATYAVQYFAPALADYNKYMRHYADAFSKESILKWGDRFISFRSLMEVVD